MDAILLDRAKNFKDHDIYTSRLLALRYVQRLCLWM